ncbi:MAG: hypothetical protein A2201_06425 [Alicyclobacillus sp. RIFOXYA1_FULL_53_8]|nr:MAG: hypothetical protein A2201_06425 [Alicyclobacillus sp. RIFOXYA1_FULL_53_8]
MPHTKHVELEVELVAEDNLGPHAKVNVWSNSTPTLIRWGLDFYTYKFLQPVWAGLKNLDYPNARLILTRHDHVAPHAQPCALQCLQNGRVVDEIYFRCSQLFLANLQWVMDSENALGLADLEWNRLANQRITIDTSRSALQRQSSKRLLFAAVGFVALVGLGAAFSRLPKAPLETHNNTSSLLKPETAVSANATDISSGNAVSSSRPNNAIVGSATPLGAHSQTPADLMPVWSVPRGDVALTIDDGPSPYTMAMIEVLKKYQVHATFFFVGSQVKYWPNAVQAALAAGDGVGDHSETHAVLSGLSKTQQESEILGGARTIEQVAAGAPADLFRPPYGAFDTVTRQILSDNHMELVLWNSDPRDWAATNQDQIVRAVVTDDPSGKVIALNERPLTLAALPAIIEKLQRRGLHFVTLSSPSGGSAGHLAGSVTGTGQGK